MQVVRAIIAAAAASVAMASDPAQMVHIAFAGADANGYPDAMTLMWQTETETATSTCQYSTSPSLSSAVSVTGSQSSYYQSWQHVARTNTLQPSTKYFYSCGDAAAGMSPVYNFTSGGGAAQRNVTILQVGDMGVYESYYTRQLIDQLAPQADMLLWSGDICYADDAFLHDPVGFGYEETWDVCQTWLQNVTTFLPFMVAPGNHEAECHSPACLLDDERKEKLHNFSAYNHRFTMPSDVSSPNPGVLNQWYSFNIGPVHVVAFDSETSYYNSPNDSYTGLPNGNFGNQLAWLTADLQHANSAGQRAQRPWIVATTHRPLYSLGDCDENGNPTGGSGNLARVFETLLYNNSVDVHFSGHIHAYERQQAVYKNQLDSRAPVYIVSGAGGNTESHSDLSRKAGVKWNAYFNTVDYGIGAFEVSPSQLTWSFFKGTDGSLLDTVTLRK